MARRKTLKEIRKAAGFTQKDIAKKLDYSESHYSLLENGKRTMSLQDGRALANLLGLSTDEIFLAVDLAKRQAVKSKAG